MSQPSTDDVASNRRPLVCLLLANAISMSGNRMALVAIPWFVLQTTGSASKVGLTAFFSFLPIVFAGFLAGPLVDRFGFKRSSMVADIASCFAIALIPLLYQTVGLEFGQLLGLVFLGALLDAPGATARTSLIADAAGWAGMTLDRTSSLEDAIERAAGLIGAPLAGILIGVIGTSNVLWVNAATFLVSIVLVGFGVPGTTKDEAPSSNYLNDLKEGVRFVRQNTLILFVILSITVTNLFDGAIEVVTPVYVNALFDDATVLGAMLGLFGAGAVVGALTYSAWGAGFSRRSVFILGFCVVAVRPLVLAQFPPLWVLLVVSFVTGLGAGPINPIVGAVLLEKVPQAIRGRAVGVTVAIAFMAIPLGVLAGGYLVEWIGLRPTLYSIGVAYLLTTLSLLLNPGSRGLERQVSEPEPMLSSTA